MRLPVLRETRMPAVLVTIGHVQTALDQTPDVVQAVVAAIAGWARGDSSST
jgi:N-acetylmuramoyl-L-alanine amidase